MIEDPGRYDKLKQHIIKIKEKRAMSKDVQHRRTDSYYEGSTFLTDNTSNVDIIPGDVKVFQRKFVQRNQNIASTYKEYSTERRNI